MRKLIFFICSALLSTSAFSIAIGGPRGFDFGVDGNLYFSQGPTSAFPSNVGFEGVATLSGTGLFAEYASLDYGASTAPIMLPDGSFYVARAATPQVRQYSNVGSLQSFFWLTSNVVAPSDMGQIDDLVEGPNGNLYLYVHVNGKGLIQEYTKSGALVHESQLLDWANPAMLSFAPDGVLYAADRYSVTIYEFDESLNASILRSFSQLTDLRDFYIDSNGNLLFTSRAQNQTAGLFSLFDPLADTWDQVVIDIGIPLQIIEAPDNVNFNVGNYLVGFIGDLPHYGGVLEFSNNMELLATYRADEPSGPTNPPSIPEPSTVLLILAAGLGLVVTRVGRKASTQ